MLEPILGPAWPAVLARGLRVNALDDDGVSPIVGTLLRTADATDAVTTRRSGRGTPHGRWLVAWDDAPDEVRNQDDYNMTDLQIDYAERSTRDAVVRALLERALHDHDAGGFAEVDDLHGEDIRGEDIAVRLRDIAAARWGGQ